MCAELGFLPDQYLDLTLKEIFRAYNGLQIREARSWEQTRQLMYTVACLANEKNKDINIYEMLPLITDPTETEMEQMRQQREDQLRMDVKNIMEFYKSKGYLS